jgi:CRP-like cAMP-binding protein
MENKFKKYIQHHIKMSDEQFELLTAETYVQSFKKGSIVLQQQVIDTTTYFVTKGLLRSYSIDQAGKEHIIQFAPENWWIGDRDSFFFNEPAQFIIDAIEDTEVIHLNKNFFEKACELVPAFNQWNNKALQNSIRFMQKRINLLLGATAEVRYLDFIKLYPNLALRVPQTLIASYLGITPESLSRVRKELALKNFKVF